MTPRAIDYCSILAGAGLLSACVGTPRIEQPLPVVAQAWSKPNPSADPASLSELASLLGSPQLVSLIESARAASPRLLAASARIDQARTRLRVARGAALPTLSVGASLAARSRDLGSAFDFTSNFATIDAALSFNLGGAAAAARRSADARTRAAVLEHEALEVTLTAEVARSFVARAALEARLGLLDGSIKDAAELQRIIELRQREGVATKVDVGLQAIRVEQLRAEHDRLEQALDETRVALALLVGAEAPGFRSVPAQIRGFALPSIGLPSPARLIGDRLDVRAAEARIAAAGGDVATARAAFFPRIDVSLSRSAQAMLASGPLSGITFGADLLAPIFDRHRLRSGLDEAVAVERETIQAYR